MADFSKYPTEKLLQAAQAKGLIKVGSIFGKVPLEKYQQGERNILGNITDRPAAMAREAIRERPYLAPLGAVAGLVPGGKKSLEAAYNPNISTKFQEQWLDKYYGTGPQTGMLGKLLRIAKLPGGMGISAAGLAADIYTDPAALALILAGKIPTGGGTTLGGKIGATKAGQALTRFGTRERLVGGARAGEGLPTGAGLKRQWAKFKQHPVSNVERVKRAVSGKKEFVKGRITIEKEASAKLIQADKEYTTNLLKNTDTVIDNNIQAMQMKLQQAAEKGSLEIQPQLKVFIKHNSNAYKKILGGIEDGLIKRGQMVSKGDVSKVLTRTLQEAIETELPAGKCQMLIQNLLESKYGTPQFSKNFSIGEILNDIRNVRASISAGAQAGRAGYTGDEMIVSLLNKNWGNFIGEKVPELAQLNARYAPIIQAKKIAYKTFKPFAGEFETKTGTQFLKRIGTGKAEAGELRFLQQLEKGSEFAPGIGKVSGPVKKIGKTLKATEEGKAIAKQQIQAQALGRQAKIEAQSLARQQATTKYLSGWLNKLSDLERKTVLAQWQRRGGMVAGGGLLLYLIKRKLLDKVLDALSGGGEVQTSYGGGG